MNIVMSAGEMLDYLGIPDAAVLTNRDQFAHIWKILRLVRVRGPLTRSFKVDLPGKVPEQMTRTSHKLTGFHNKDCAAFKEETQWGKGTRRKLRWRTAKNGEWGR
jgi:hypothetical protein